MHKHNLLGNGQNEPDKAKPVRQLFASCSGEKLKKFLLGFGILGQLEET